MVFNMQDLLNKLLNIQLPQIPHRGNSLDKTEIPDSGGIYCFWWMTEQDPLEDYPFLNPIPSIGPGNNVVWLPVNDDYFIRTTNGAIPLYVGKTGCLSKRFGQHLMLGTLKTAVYENYNTPLVRRNSSCQFRHGMDTLFPEINDTKQLTLNNIGVSWVELDGIENSYQRCFFEHYAISHFKPFFNYDIER